jgi:hypothetical protein
MPDRAAKFVSAIVAGVLAGTSLGGLAFNVARAADDCLAAPNSETPQGSHWYYRIEHGTKRHCWYLRAEGETPSQAAAPNSSGPAKPVAPTAAAPMQRSVADAHAELPPKTSIEPPRGSGAPAPAMPTNRGGGRRGAIGRRLTLARPLRHEFDRHEFDDQSATGARPDGRQSAV